MNKDKIDFANLIQFQLFSINELKKFGIARYTLNQWYKDGILKPYTFAGSIAKFRYEDFQNACLNAKKTNIDKQNNFHKAIINKLA